MEKINTVKKAQDDWQTPVNKVINAVNGLMGGGRAHSFD